MAVKIVATIGPATWDANVIAGMYKYGMQIARINSSFADFEEMKRDKELMASVSPDIALMMDTQGPKMRITGLEKSIIVKNGDILTLSPQKEENTIQVDHPYLYKDVSIRQPILIDDGNIVGKVIAKEETSIKVKITNGGTIINRKTVNAPGAHLSLPLLSQRDKKNILNAVKLNYHYIALSFVQTANDIRKVRKLLGDSSIWIVAKIETLSAVNNLDDIIKEADALMVARGDLGVELPIEQVPVTQKAIISVAKMHGKPVIVATQMLESMRENIRPTRAEVTDVANAILDGADAVMLSGETSVGKYPVECVKVMHNVNKSVNTLIQPFYDIAINDNVWQVALENIAQIVKDGKFKAVVIFTVTGTTLRCLSSMRINVPIISITSNYMHHMHATIIRDVQSILVDSAPSRDRDEFIKFMINTLSKNNVQLASGDLIMIVGNSNVDTTTSGMFWEIVKI